MEKNIKVVLADDHRSVLKNVSALLGEAPNIELLGTASNGEKAFNLAQSTLPDVLILDMDMPKLSGLQVAAKLQKLGVAVKIIILSIYDEPAIVKAAFKNGVQGYVLKDFASSDLVKAVQTVFSGKIFISKPLSRYHISG